MTVVTDGPGSISGFQSLGYGVLLLYLFLIYSRIFDVKFSQLHIPGISYRIIMAMVVLARAFQPSFRHGIGKWMIFLTFWFVAAIPTSQWRGGSKDLFLSYWLPAFVVFMATSGLIMNFDQVQKAVKVLAYGFFVLTLIAWFWGSTEETGRLFLPNGKFSNPNEMAQALLIGMPLWWLMFQEAKGIGKKVFAAGVVFLMLLMISKCGSRGAMISFAATILVVFLRANMMGKMKLVVGGVVLLSLIVAVTPGKLLRRYQTISSDEGADPIAMMSSDDYDANMQVSAITSTQHRRQLLQTSIRYTFQHPLFGVGPGMFAVAEDAEMRAQGFHKGSWQGTHNSYTQVSSEIGIPALIAYVMMMVLSLKRSSAIYRQTRGDPRLASIAGCALALNYCMIVYAISVFFDYIAYTTMLSVFAGLIMALDLHAPAEIASRTAVPLDVPIPFEQFKRNLARRARAHVVQEV